MKEHILFFDLDGTLTDSEEGIVRSVAAALGQMGIISDEKTLKKFIGPPLTWSFPHYYGLGEQETQEAIRLFRVRYSSVGKFENKVYDGIPETLGALRTAGYRLAVATSKPEHFALEITDHFDLTRYFDLVAGTTPDESGTKVDVIRDALSRLGSPAPSDVLMIGDREHDMDGAHTVGLRAVGALWGYGSREELTAHGAEFLAAQPRDLCALLGNAGES